MIKEAICTKEIWAFSLKYALKYVKIFTGWRKDFVKRFSEAVVASNIPIFPLGIWAKLIISQICVGLIWFFGKGSFSWW